MIRRGKGVLSFAIIQVSNPIMTWMQTFLGQGEIAGYQQAYLII